MFDTLYSYITSQVPLPDEAWHDMQRCLSTRQLQRKEHFLREDEVCRNLGFISSGLMRLYYLADGVDVTKDFNFEGWFCGSYASFSLQQPSRFTIVAMEPTTLYLVSRDNLYRLADTWPAVQKMMRLQIERMFIYKELRETSFLLDTPEQRYRDLLSRQPGILQRIPLKYIASYLGIAPETLSRIRAGSMG